MCTFGSGTKGLRVLCRFFLLLVQLSFECIFQQTRSCVQGYGSYFGGRVCKIHRFGVNRSYLECCY